MADERPLHEVLLDYAVFAPIGLLVEVVEDFPTLTDKGRRRVAKELTMARTLGQLAVGQLQHRFERLVGAGRPGEQPDEGLLDDELTAEGEAELLVDVDDEDEEKELEAAGAGLLETADELVEAALEPPASGDDTGAAGDELLEAADQLDEAVADEEVEEERRRATDAIVAAVLDEPGAPAAPVPPAGHGEEAPSADTLAIPGYDTLAASQVVQRLPSLTPDELEAIRRYEIATRGRRTILHRVAQLASSDRQAS